MHHDIIKSILSIDFIEFENAYYEIHDLLDNYLGRNIILPVFNSNFLIEQNSDYTGKLLELANPNFYEIKSLSVSAYNIIKNDSIYYSLQRGVKYLQMSLNFMHICTVLVICIMKS